MTPNCLLYSFTVLIPVFEYCRSIGGLLEWSRLMLQSYEIAWLQMAFIIKMPTFFTVNTPSDLFFHLIKEIMIWQMFPCVPVSYVLFLWFSVPISYVLSSGPRFLV